MLSQSLLPAWSLALKLICPCGETLGNQAGTAGSAAPPQSGTDRHHSLCIMMRHMLKFEVLLEIPCRRELAHAFVLRFH